MSIAKGSTDISNIYLGSDSVSKIYLGDDLVFDSNRVVVIEYLESSGTQYIDTGLYVDNTFTFDTEVAPLSDSVNCVYWGVRNSGNYNTAYQQCYLNSNTASSNALYKKIRLLSTKASSTANWDSGDVPTANTFYSYSGMTLLSGMNEMGYPLTLFALNNIGTISAANSKCRIASFTAYSGGMRVMDMIPVRIGSVGYMYDMVSQNYFGNDGTGDFILGADV